MNVPVSWIQVLTDGGYDAIHWSSVGDPRAKDHEIMA
jgi:predicted nuclease of predicted toxin-antitoxin system